MSNKFHKLLTISASALLLASVGASVTTISNTPVSVQAAKKHHKKHHKKHKHSKKHYKVSASVKAGNWYNKNAKGLYNRFNNQGLFSQGQSDGSTNQQMNINYYNNPQYKEGWIIAYANGKDRNNVPDANFGGTVQGYSSAYHLYQNGVKFINSKHPNYNPKLINNSINWTTDYQRTINDDNN